MFDTQSESNRADINDYLRRELASQLQSRPDADRLVDQILKKSAGVFLYVERFCDDVHRGHVSLDRPGQFPRGLGGIFCQYFERQFPDVEKFRKDLRPALRAILAAREPLPVEILQRLFNWQDEDLRDFTRPIASLFPVSTEVCTRMTHYDSAFLHLRSAHYATPKTDPADTDDIAFLLCAWNGLASHLVSYDHDLLDLSATYKNHFRICPPLEFLSALRTDSTPESPLPSHPSE